MIEENLAAVRRNIENAAKASRRRLEDITLVCVTKQVDAGRIREVLECGVSDIGENRIQDAAEKYKILGRAAKWHLIGHLQTNKVKKAVEIFDLIHSIDSLHIAEAVSKEAGKINKAQDVLIEVNTSGEASKFGIKPEEALSLLEQIKLLNNIRVLGLMTIASLTDDSEKSRVCFRMLRELSKEAELGVLSMGMSQDYQIAIEEGATMVRIGSAIFK